MGAADLTMGFSIETGAVIRAARALREAGQNTETAAAEGIQLAALISSRDLKDVALAGKHAQRQGLFMTAPAQFALGHRTGETAASVTMLVTRSGNHYQASVGTPLRHVLTSEKGATIRSRSGGMLAIPTIHALTPSGDLNNLFAGLRSLRDARTKSGRRLFVLRKRRSGVSGAWLAGIEGPMAGRISRHRGSGRFQRAGRLVLYFLLRRSVNIPARYMFRHAKRRVEPQIVDALDQAVGVRVFEVFG